MQDLPMFYDSGSSSSCCYELLVPCSEHPEKRRILSILLLRDDKGEEWKNRR